MVLHVHGENAALLRRRGDSTVGIGMVDASGRAPTTCGRVRSIQNTDQVADRELSSFIATADLVQVIGEVVRGGKGWAQWLEVGSPSFFFDLGHDQWAESRKILLVTSRFHDAIVCCWKMRA